MEKINNLDYKKVLTENNEKNFRAVFKKNFDEILYNLGNNTDLITAAKQGCVNSQYKLGICYKEVP